MKVATIITFPDSPNVFGVYDEWLVERAPAWVGPSGGYHHAYSAALVCPACRSGKAWATLVQVDDLATPYVWPVAAFCREHTTPENWFYAGPPGSILIDYGLGDFDVPLLEGLSDPLLTREFNLHLKLFEEKTRCPKTRCS